MSYPPCNDIVFEILNKRNWKFDFISYDKSLEHLKTLCKTIGFKEKITLVRKSGNIKISTTKEKHEWIAWKTARRSNITNLMMDGKQIEMVMSAVGHKKSSTTAKYQHQHAGLMVDALVG
jgi:site-specific recombinase XerD